MRSGLRPVATSCNKYFYRRPFTDLVDARPRFENAFTASEVLREPILCKKTNFVELAFSEVTRLPISIDFVRGLHARIRLQRIPALHGRPARRHPSGVVPWERLKVLTK